MQYTEWSKKRFITTLCIIIEVFYSSSTSTSKFAKKAIY